MDPPSDFAKGRKGNIPRWSTCVSWITFGNASFAVQHAARPTFELGQSRKARASRCFPPEKWPKASFDDLVGAANEWLRYGQAQCPRRLEIKHKLDLGL